MDDELERFKSEIDLRAFAASLGFTLNRRDSWRGSAVMELGKADKIIITRERGHDVYFSVKDDHRGTIIDLAMRYWGVGLGEVRKRLRRVQVVPVAEGRARLEKPARDPEGVARAWNAATPYGGHPWLERERAIPRSLALSARFAGRLKIDGRGNVVFAHVNGTGRLCGFEKKNRGFTGFAAGGEKGLGVSADLPADRQIVFAESFIDALSYAALFPDAHARYRSFGGGLNPKQPALIRAHIEAMPPGAAVVAATDGDEAGASFASLIRGLCPERAFRAHRPDKGDWNDVLRGTSPPAGVTPNLDLQA
jgi:hypothetical protein